MKSKYRCVPLDLQLAGCRRTFNKENDVQSCCQGRSFDCIKSFTNRTVIHSAFMPKETYPGVDSVQVQAEEMVRCHASTFFEKPQFYS